MTFEVALEKLKYYCAYQERSLRDVELKIKKLEVDFTLANSLIEELQNEDYLNQERFIEAFVSGKHRIKRWGKLKIKQGLAAKGIPSSAFGNHIKDIDPDEYLSNLRYWIDRSQKADKVKLIRFLQQKGFELDMILKEV